MRIGKDVLGNDTVLDYLNGGRRRCGVSEDYIQILEIELFQKANYGADE